MTCPPGSARLSLKPKELGTLQRERCAGSTSQTMDNTSISLDIQVLDIHLKCLNVLDAAAWCLDVKVSLLHSNSVDYIDANVTSL